MDGGGAHYLIAVISLVVGIAAVICIRYSAIAVIAGGIAFVALRATLPDGTYKLHALDRFGDAAIATCRRGALFGKLFVADLGAVTAAALLAGAVIGVVILLRRG